MRRLAFLALFILALRASAQLSGSCEGQSDCNSCVQLPDCGWCLADGAPGVCAQSASCAGTWALSATDCSAASSVQPAPVIADCSVSSDCTSCLATPGCTWCPDPASPACVQSGLCSVAFVSDPSQCAAPELPQPAPATSGVAGRGRDCGPRGDGGGVARSDGVPRGVLAGCHRVARGTPGPATATAAPAAARAAALAFAEADIRADVLALLQSQDVIAGLVRCEYHDAFCSGADGSLHFPEELARPENKRLNSDTILNQAKYAGVTWADAIAVGSAAAIEAAGGPRIPVGLGRLDATRPGANGQARAPPCPFVRPRRSSARPAQLPRLDMTIAVALSGVHVLRRVFGPVPRFSADYFTQLLGAGDNRTLADARPARSLLPGRLPHVLTPPRAASSARTSSSSRPGPLLRFPPPPSDGPRGTQADDSRAVVSGYSANLASFTDDFVKAYLRSCLVTPSTAVRYGAFAYDPGSGVGGWGWSYQRMEKMVEIAIGCADRNNRKWCPLLYVWNSGAGPRGPCFAFAADAPSAGARFRAAWGPTAAAATAAAVQACGAAGAAPAGTSGSAACAPRFAQCM
eukprot:tig00000989_g6111.t1